MLIKFNPKVLMGLMKALTHLEAALDGYKYNKIQPDPQITESLKNSYQKFLTSLQKYCEKIGLIDSANTLKDIIEDIPKDEVSILQGKIDLVTKQIYRQLDQRSFFAISPENSKLYEQSFPFGEQVNLSFPSINYDIEQGTKCYATGRYTASVFHFMKVMEKSLQIFGKKLNVPIDPEKDTWKIINDGLNTKINAMDPHIDLTKEYHAASSHLNNVRIAWRNDVMHPKQSYDEEEAKEVFQSVKTFISHLAIIKELRENT